MELSEEEKKAIDFLKEIVLEFEKCNSEYVIDKDDKYGFLNSFKVIINVIEKQQKEIERIKSLDIYKLTEEWETGQLIHKDKIRAKIEDLESLSKNITMQPSVYNYEIDLLKELLEENK